MNNHDLIHDFFYCNYDEQCGNLHFEVTNIKGGYIKILYSYKAPIGIIFDINNKKEVILSRNRYSVTTSQHQSAMIAACPYNYTILNTCDVFGNYDDSSFNSAFKYIEFEKDVNKTKTEDRKNDIKKYEDAIFLKSVHKLYHKYKPYYWYDIDSIKKFITKNRYRYQNYLKKEHELQEKRRNKKELTEEEKLKREEDRLRKHDRYTKYLDSSDKLELINAFYNKHHELHTKIRNIIKTLYGTKGDIASYLNRVFNYNSHITPSLIWPSGNTVKTSQGVIVFSDIIKPLIAYWKSGANMVDMKVDRYTIIEQNVYYTKVGCHRIPNWNLELLYDYFTKH